MHSYAYGADKMHMCASGAYFSSNKDIEKSDDSRTLLSFLFTVKEQGEEFSRGWSESSNNCFRCPFNFLFTHEIFNMI